MEGARRVQLSQRCCRSGDAGFCFWRRNTSPREHIGESLLPGTIAVMKRMGVYDKVDDAGFVHKYGATYVWGKSRDPWTIHFSEVTEKPIHTFQVNRAKFDKILLDHSQESGVTVLQGCRATGVRRSDADVMLVDYLDANQSPQTAACRMCVDASGQNSFLGRDLGLRKLNPSLRNIALFTYFEGRKVYSGPGAGPRAGG